MVAVAVDGDRAVVMAVGRDEELADHPPRGFGRDASGREIRAVEADEPRIRTPQRELVGAVRVAEDLPREPQRVQALEEGARRFPRTTLRRVCDATQIVRLFGKE